MIRHGFLGGGSSKFFSRVFRLASVTPNSSAVNMSIGFFLALMMLSAVA